MWKFIDPKRVHKTATKRVQKSAASQKTLDALNAYLEAEDNELMQWVVRLWQDQGNAFTYEELQQIVTDELSPQELFKQWFQDYADFVRDKMTAQWQKGFIAGARANEAIQTLEDFSFNTSAENVRQWIVDRGGQFITNCTQTQLDAVKYIIAESTNKKMSPAETARYIRPLIGLTKQQSSANLNLYNTVKENLKKDHPKMSEEAVERKAREAAARDAARKQRYRAETIALTENAYAYNFGNDEAIKQAEAAGLMPHMVGYWVTGSENVCDVCESLNGSTVSDDGEYHGYHNKGRATEREYTCVLPPMHPRCRCVIEYREE